MKREDEKEQRKETGQEHRKESPGHTEAPTRPAADMKPLTKEAYGGGMYGTDDKKTAQERANRPPASDSQSVDGLAAGDSAPSEKILSHPPPPSSGDRDIDITGQSYIQ
ncbi:hypothetical protein SUGI_0466990 [Cryptomeria japonica]|uniref:uncharacterized protein LOC131076596 n=1 Tax=Cryptomeria japonica TaxID=3369 RepID=UPI00240895F8|nr:uncharacterized protein LOC131076596 [Cryptomeria japonica]GLJ24455.1 hypothetical protein SUGI_0466990 [Cryptomeria japonica]